VESVQLLHFRSPFSRELDDLRQLVRSEWPRTVFRTQSIKKEYRRLVGISEDGTYSLAKSCINCRSLLLGKAVRFMERVGADYLVTGEAPGARGVEAPDLTRIAESLGVGDRVLRPLCCPQHLDSDSELGVWASHRARASRRFSRPEELADLAMELGVSPVDPLGACRRCKLTTPGFGDRVASLFGEVGFTLNALRLLDFELFYKVRPDTKIVLARNEIEKRELQNLFLPQDLRVYPSTPHGPMTLVRTNWDRRRPSERAAVVELAARITATYVAPGRGSTIPIYYRLEMEDETSLLNSMPFASPEEVAGREDIEMIPLWVTEPAMT
jgi:tRNA-specific 2-thiouridylase